jgi:hypothetical protein
MSLPELMKSIETPRFSSYLGLANNTVMFQDVLEGQPVVQQLLIELRDPAVSRKLLARVESLAREQDDIRFRNQLDAALAVYTWALDRTDHSLGKLAASVVLDVPRLWWARKTALQILGGSFGQPTVEQPDILMMTNDWNTTATKEGKDALIIMAPPSVLVRSESVLNPASIKSEGEKNTDTLDTSSSQLTTVNTSTVVTRS